MKIGTKGLEIIKKFEGLRLQSYLCPAGVWTIGYGHTHNVKAGDVCTKEQAEQWLLEDCADAEKCINNKALHINQNQFDALVSFVYNVGQGNFENSTLLKRIKGAASPTEIEAQFLRWTYANGKRLNGLIRRRIAEAKLYNSI